MRSGTESTRREDSVFHVGSIERLRRLFTGAVMDNCAIPCIEPVADSGYELGDDRSRFWIHDLNVSYDVEIRRVPRVR